MVIELFKARGWQTIVSDDLVGYVLGYTTFTVGILTGLCSMGLEMVVDANITPSDIANDTEKELSIPPDVAEYWEDSNKSFLFGPLPGPQYIAFV